ncbi:MAG: cytochrome c oxidase subunit II [Pseudomonadota bacterium]
MPDGQVFEYEKQSGTLYGFNNAFPEARMVKDKRHIEVLALSDAGDRRILYPGDDFEVNGLGGEEVRVTLNEPLPTSEHLMIRAGRTRVGKKKVLGLFGRDRSQVVPAPTVTIKATGYQWGWAYSYPDFGDFEFDALMMSEAEAGKDLYRFATTNDIVIPVGETVRLVTTGRDVIHSWAMPSFGVKIDAIPGRLNETWFYTEQEKTFYGQCSEICGKDHAFMPISVRVVSRDEFEAWIDEKRDYEGLEPLFSGEKLADAATTKIADNEVDGSAPVVLD